MATILVNANNTSGIEDGSVAHPFGTIQGGVDAANAGDTVIVEAGTYREVVKINKSLILEGVGCDKTIISSDPGCHQGVIEITSNDVRVSGFTVTAPVETLGTGTGILVRAVSRIVISNNKVKDFSRGEGIELGAEATFVYIWDNTVADNCWGILTRGTGCEVYPQGYSQCFVERNVLLNNTDANIFFQQASANNIRFNRIRGNSRSARGICLYARCDHNIIEHNEVNNINGDAIVIVPGSMTAPSYNSIANNTVESNSRGISIQSGRIQPTGNQIYRNNIIDNTMQAVSGGLNNSWDNGAGEGNYWSDYRGTDLNGDCIGDTDVPHAGLDFYPSIKPLGRDIFPPPSPVLNGPPSPVEQTPLMISGSAQPRSIVQLFVNGTKQREAVVDESGSFSVAVDLNEGENVLTANAVDEAGNVSTESEFLVVVLDTVPPESPILSPLPLTTATAEIIVEGRVERGSSVELFINGASRGTAKADGHDHFAFNVLLSQGVNIITAKAADAAGNISKPSSDVSVLFQRAGEIGLALNPSGVGYPHPLESDRGWGGGSNKWEIIDGKRVYPNEWAHGLAFTGGKENWTGEPCGQRQAIIDFGAPRIFHRVAVWNHGPMHFPKESRVQYWDGAEWLDIDSTREVNLEGEYGTWSASDTHKFSPVVGSKVRYVFDNCKESIDGGLMEHGWIYEFEVYGPEEQSVVTYLGALPVSAIEGIGKVYASKLKRQKVKTVGDLAGIDVPTLSKKTGISVFRLSVMKKRALLVLGVKVGITVPKSMLSMRVEEVLATSDDEVGQKGSLPAEVVAKLKADISTLLLCLDDALVKTITLERLARF